MAAYQTRKNGVAAKNATLAMRNARLSKRAPSAVATRSGHVKAVSLSTRKVG